jgi:phage shock protein PspC (stress-responsive transcriptional regulator)
MKKTISMTLGGRVFQIEEDAYAMLESYLSGLKRHFSKDGPVDELLVDIEASLGEKFADRIGPQKEAITKADTEAVIAMLGTLEELSDDVPGAGEGSPTGPEPTTKKRLYRNPDDQIVAGVCSGLAAYFGVTPTVMRILFCVLAFVNGIGMLAYIILWAAVPMAETQAQKLEMRGKPMNVEEIERLVKEKAARMGEESKKARLPQLVARVVQSIIGVVVPFVSIFLGIILLLGAFSGLAAVSIAGALLLFSGDSATMFLPELPLEEIASQPLYVAGVISVCVLAFVPLVLLLMLATTLIRRRSQFRGVTVALLAGIWILALGGASAAAYRFVPWAETRLTAIERAPAIEREFPVSSFEAVELSDQTRARIVRGTTFSVRATGRPSMLDSLSVQQEGQVLRVHATHAPRMPCFFCAFEPAEVTITMPSLDRLLVEDVSSADVRGFLMPMKMTVRDAARVSAVLEGQSVAASVEGVGRADLSGRIGDLEVSASDAARFSAEGIQASWVRIRAQDVARVYVSGTADRADVTVRPRAGISLEALQVKSIKTNTE